MEYLNLTWCVNVNDEALAVVAEHCTVRRQRRRRLGGLGRHRASFVRLSAALAQRNFPSALAQCSEARTSFFFQWLGLPPPLPAHPPASLFGLQRLVLLSVYGLRGVTDATLAALARPGRCSTTLTTLDVHGCCNVSVLTKAAGLSRLFFSRGHFVAQCFGHLTSGGGPCLGTLQVKRQSEVGLLELFPKLTCFTHHS